MAILIRCDACDGELGREVFGVSLVGGTMVANAQSEARFVAEGVTAESVLCELCARYVDDCIALLSRRMARLGQPATAREALQ